MTFSQKFLQNCQFCIVFLGGEIETDQQALRKGVRGREGWREEGRDGRKEGRREGGNRGKEEGGKTCMDFITVFSMPFIYLSAHILSTLNLSCLLIHF